jgi:hypothetical protein
VRKADQARGLVDVDIGEGIRETIEDASIHGTIIIGMNGV